MRTLVLVMAVVAAACGNGATAPSSPQPVQAAGTWRGDLRVTSGTGEPCVGAAFQSAAGISFEYTLRVQQSGGQLTATSMSPATGDCLPVNRHGPKLVDRAEPHDLEQCIAATVLQLCGEHLQGCTPIGADDKCQRHRKLVVG